MKKAILILCAMLALATGLTLAISSIPELYVGISELEGVIYKSNKIILGSVFLLNGCFAIEFALSLFQKVIEEKL